MGYTTGQAQAVRQAVEARMEARFPGALTLRTKLNKPRLSFGIAALDALCGGGAPLGAVTEMTGEHSCGKTTAGMQLVASALREGRVCAWVDAADSFNPASGEANGIQLHRLLWVRCSAAGPAGELSIAMRGDSTPLIQAISDRVDSRAAQPVVAGHCGSHPRAEAQGMDRAVGGLFKAQMRPKPGTPGAANLPLSASTVRHQFAAVPRAEQVASDRAGGRKVAGHQAPSTGRPLKQEAHGGLLKAHPIHATQSLVPGRSVKPWTGVDQALRATDLLLQGGGFSLVVLDLAGIAADVILRIQAATWFRFRAMAEESGTALLLLTDTACARSSAALVLMCSPMQVSLAGGTVIETMRYQVETARQRLQPEQAADGQPGAGRKQPMATWQVSPFCMPAPPADLSPVLVRTGIGPAR